MRLARKGGNPPKLSRRRRSDKGRVSFANWVSRGSLTVKPHFERASGEEGSSGAPHAQKKKKEEERRKKKRKGLGRNAKWFLVWKILSSCSAPAPPPFLLLLLLLLGPFGSQRTKEEPWNMLRLHFLSHVLSFCPPFLLSWGLLSRANVAPLFGRGRRRASTDSVGGRCTRGDPGHGSHSP